MIVIRKVDTRRWYDFLLVDGQHVGTKADSKEETRDMWEKNE